MSSTRRAAPNAPLSQERYMSSPEFAELRAISGTAVARRCALLMSPAKRQLLWFIQGMSLAEGGIRQLAKDLLAMFPKRLIPFTRSELDGTWDWDLDEPGSKPEPSIQESAKFAVERRQAARRDQYSVSHRQQSLEEFLIDLCINPRLVIQFQGAPEVHQIATEIDTERAKEEFPELEDADSREAKLCYFRDIIGALVEYKQLYEDRVRSEFCPTAISRQIWKQLDYALKSKSMIVLDGLEGRGKTEAVRAWCNCHLGVSRFMSLSGTGTKTAHFREFARALGVGHTASHTISHMQARVEEVLRVSHLMPVIDEAHFAFSQAMQVRMRPEMLDWIDTALCNPPLPVALVTTPQFMVCVERAARVVGWNHRQFKRRCKRYCRLPGKNTPEDIEAVARHLLPEADKATIKQIVGYEALSNRDLSAVGDAVREAKLLAEEDGARRVMFEHVKRAIYKVLLPSDVPWAEMEKRLQHQKLGRKALRLAPAAEPEAGQEPAETRERDIPPRPLAGTVGGNRMRFREPLAALAGDPKEAVLTPG